jgi:Immunity protein 51
MEDYNFAPVRLSWHNHDGKVYYRVQIFCGYDVAESVTELFDKYDNYDNGYGWEGLVKYIMEKERPDLIEYFDFDCEADTFLTKCLDEGEDKAVQLARLLHNIIADEKRLEQYLKELPDEYKDA